MHWFYCDMFSLIIVKLSREHILDKNILLELKKKNHKFIF